MGDLHKDQYFTIRDGQLLYVGEPITAALVDEAREVLKSHQAPDQSIESLYRSLFFCIASQRTKYEAAVRFGHMIERASFKELIDPVYLATQGMKAGLLHSNNPDWDRERKGANRFYEVMDFIDHYDFDEMPIVKLSRELLEHPMETRRMLAKAKCNLAPKTASFWYLCLGGRELMTLDTHNYRQIAGLGPIEVKKEHYEGGLRKIDGRMINTTPSVRGYERIERETLEALACCELLRDEGGKTDAALATALFWVAGAKAVRRNRPSQGTLFGERPFGFTSPYRA